METIHILHLFALIYGISGLGMLLRPQSYSRVFHDVAKHASLGFMGGIGSLIIGYLLITYIHDTSIMANMLLLLIGWMAIVKWVILLFMPDWHKTILTSIANSHALLRTIAFVLIIIALLVYLLARIS